MKLAYSNQLESLSLFQQQCERWLTEDINPGTESLLLETTERLFELNTMTQGVLAQLKFFIGN